jgi:hypothetical protein
MIIWRSGENQFVGKYELSLPGHCALINNFVYTGRILPPTKGGVNVLIMKTVAALRLTNVPLETKKKIGNLH